MRKVAYIQSVPEEVGIGILQSFAGIVVGGEELAEYDANGNKSYSQAEYKAAIDSLHLSTEHSGILWQPTTGAKTAKNNPHSTEAGEMALRVLD